VVAACAAAREISKTAVVWALTHVVQHGDSILLLVVIPPPSSGRKFWGFPFFAGDCASGHKAVLNQKSDVSELCSQMMLKLHEVYDPNKINVKVRILSGLPSGTVATESKRAQASWVVLDKELKHEEKRCLEELQCNIVVMKRSRPKVLRLNLVGSPEKESNSTPQLPPEPSTSDCNTASNINGQRSSIQGPSVTPSSSPESEAPFDITDAGTSSVSSSDPATYPFCASDTNSSLTKEATKDNIQHSDVNISDSESEVSTPPAASSLKPWMADILQEPAPTRLLGNRPRRTPTADSLLEKIAKLDLLTEINAIRSRSDLNFRGNVRDASHCPGGYLPDHRLCVLYVNIRHLYLGNHHGGSAMRNWSLQLVASPKQISWLKVGLGLFTEVSSLMAKQLLSSSTNLLAPKVMSSFAQRWRF